MLHGLLQTSRARLNRPSGDARRSSRFPQRSSTGRNIAMITILVVILLLIALGAMPTWPYSRGWGYYPSGGLGLIVLILVILLLLGRI